MLPEGPGVVDMFCRILVAVDDDVISLDISRQACACRWHHTLMCNMYMLSGMIRHHTFVCNMYMQSGMRLHHTIACNMYMLACMRWHHMLVCKVYLQSSMSRRESASAHCLSLQLIAVFSLETVHSVAV